LVTIEDNPDNSIRLFLWVEKEKGD